MIKIHPIKGTDFVKHASYQDLVDELQKLDCDMHDLGESTLEGANVYGLSIGKLDGTKPIIYIEAGIHGNHEWRTCHWVPQFLQMIVKPPSSHKRYFDELRAKFSFYAIACANPYGYENTIRYNANGVDLNRNFPPFWEETNDNYKGSAPFSEPETQIIRDKVLELKPIMFIDTHSWGEQMSDAKIHAGPYHSKEYNPFYTELIRTIRMNGMTGAYEGTNSQKRPTSNAWGGEVISNSAKKTISMSLEIGGGLPEERQSYSGLNSLFIIAMNAYSWFEHRALLYSD